MKLMIFYPSYMMIMCVCMFISPRGHTHTHTCTQYLGLSIYFKHGNKALEF